MTTWATLSADRAALTAQFDALRNRGGTLQAWIADLRKAVADPDNVTVAVCYRCRALTFDGRTALMGAPGSRRDLCVDCYDGHTGACGACGERHFVDYLQTPGMQVWPDGGEGGRICATCFNVRFTTCRVCQAVYDLTDMVAVQLHRHREQSCCESPAMQFTFPYGEDALAPDVRVDVDLGTKDRLTRATLIEVGRYLKHYATSHPEMGSARVHGTRGQRLYSIGQALYSGIGGATEAIGREVKTTQGTFPTRLKRYAYKEQSLKVEPVILTEVGNIIASTRTNSRFHVEVTRDLNLTAAEFGNPNSCWWSNYKSSRCALKTNGGIGLRAFDDDGNVAGRVWVMPLKEAPDGGLTPTFATDTGIFFVFNGYGVLAEKAGARVVQSMTGSESIKLIEFNAARYYVNSSRGYLCAPEAVTARINGLHLPLEEHARLFSREHPPSAAAARVTAAHIVVNADAAHIDDRNFAVVAAQAH